MGNFWLTFSLINISFFLPYFFLNFRSQPNPLAFLTKKEVSFENKIKCIYYKVSSDPFKLHFDYVAFILIGLHFGWSGYYYQWLCNFVGLIGWFYLLYAGVMTFVFKRAPIFRSDFEFIKIGYQMHYHYRFIIWIAVLISIFIGGFLISTFTSHLLSYQLPPWHAIIALLVLAILALVKVSRIYYERFIYRTSLSATAFAIRNLFYSNRFDFLMDKDDRYFIERNHFKDITLAKKPNIKIINIESYGSVVFQDPQIYNVLKDIYDRFEQRLESAGFNMATGLSTAPVKSGGSWKSYTTLTYGLKIDDDLLYNILFKSVPAFANYESIFHFLRRQGYQNLLLCPATNYIQGTVDWDLIQRNLQSDTFFDWKKMEYKGNVVSFMGHGYCPPDQFAINKAQSIIDKEIDRPHCLFYSSLNSHYPFLSPSIVAEDWKDLNTKDFNLGIHPRTSNTIKDRYIGAIQYQLESFLSHIEKSGEGIYILFGDHQPPLITPESMGAETPIHIIAKDPDFLSSFLELGFSSGFCLNTTKTQMKHEGFFSLLVKAMEASYGDLPKNSVTYLPEGVML